MATRNGDLVHTESEYSIQDTSINGPTEIYGAPCLLMGIFVNTVLSAHTVLIPDATTAIVTLPASLAAGTMVEFPGLRFETSLNIDPNDASTGNLTIIYRKMNSD